MLFKFRPNQIENANAFGPTAHAEVARHEFTEPWFRLCDMEESRGGIVARKNEVLRMYRHCFFAFFVEAAADCNVLAGGDSVESDTVHDVDGGPSAFDHCR